MVIINGQQFDYFSTAAWGNQAAPGKLNGQAVTLTQRTLPLVSNAMPMSEWNLLQSYDGLPATVEVCGYDTIEDVVYYDCVVTAVASIQVGLNMTGVRIDVRVNQV